YELLYTPVDPAEKRRSKAWIDIGCDRLGDGLAAIVVKGLNLLPAQLPVIGLFGSAAIASALSLLTVSRLSRGYVRTLQRSLLRRAEALDLTKSTENLSRSTLLQTFAAFDRRALLAQIDQRERQAKSARQEASAQPAERAPGTSERTALGAADSPGAAASSHEAQRRPDDRFSAQILALRSGSIDAVRGVLSSESIDPALASHLIPLLAWDDVSDDVIRALRLIAPRILEQLVEALLDPPREFAVRRRVPRVIAAVGSARAVEGLREGLADKRFEVRFQCGRALAVIHRRHPEISVDRSAILAAVLRELEVDRPIWESRRL